jgi:hypothetical protein
MHKIAWDNPFGLLSYTLYIPTFKSSTFKSSGGWYNQHGGIIGVNISTKLAEMTEGVHESI